MHFDDNGAGSVDYIENKNEYFELVGSNGVTELQMYAETVEADAVKGNELLDADCISEDASTSSSFSTQGSGSRMEDSHGWCSDSGGKSRGMSSSLNALEAVVMKVLERVRAAGYGEEMCKEFREHFARLPAR